MGVVIVGLKEGAKRVEFMEALSAEGLTFTEFSAMPNLLTVIGTTAETFPLKDHPAVEFVEDNEKEAFKPAEIVTISDIPDFGPWPMLRSVHRDPPWATRGLRLPIDIDFECDRTGQNVDIYVVDTGILDTHSEFDGRATILDDWTAVHYHGTSCASCAAGETLGLAKDALIFAAAGLRNPDNTGSISDIIAAMNACLASYNDRAGLNRPAIMNLSLSGTSNSYQTAVNNCTAAGMVVCAAAGNDRENLAVTARYPALSAGVITVGGINMADEPYNTGTSGTNYGTEIDILAGSQHVRVADITSDIALRTGSGTSYGTPHVVGVIACMLQDYNRLTSRTQVFEVMRHLYNTATFGRYKPDPRFEPMTKAIAYLDPGPGPHAPIKSLVPR